MPITPKPTSRKKNIVVQNLDKEVLIYDLTINKAFCLNETAAMVYQLCDGTNSAAEISDLMSIQLKTLISEDFVHFALENLKKENLLEHSEELPSRFAGLSRREVVKKIGFASMVALPVVASIVAPSAISAASACSCVNPGDCLTQTTCPSTVNCNPSGVCAP